jgi:hypothetical protein
MVTAHKPPHYRNFAGHCMYKNRETSLYFFSIHLQFLSTYCRCNSNFCQSFIMSSTTRIPSSNDISTSQRQVPATNAVAYQTSSQSTDIGRQAMMSRYQRRMLRDHMNAALIFGQRAPFIIDIELVSCYYNLILRPYSHSDTGGSLPSRGTPAIPSR